MVGDAVREGLRQESYAVDWVRDGNAAEAALKAERYDLVVLDLGLPRRDGLEILASLRAARNDVPVLVITARDTLPDREIGRAHV